MLTVLALLPLLTDGQANGSITLTINDLAQTTLTRANCDTNLTATWTSALVGTPCSTFEMWVTAGSCGATITVGDLPLPNVSQSEFSGTTTTARTGTVNIAVDDLFTIDSDAGTASTVCSTAVVNDTFSICGAITMATDIACTLRTPVEASPTATIVFDTQPPATPILGIPDAFDGTIAVPITISADTTYYVIFIQQEQADGGGSGFVTSTIGQQTPMQLNPNITGLTNGVTYDFYAVAYNAADIPSLPSNTESAKPEPTTGFWDAYRADGGVAQGCSTTPGALGVAAVVLVGLALSRRRRS